MLFRSRARLQEWLNFISSEIHAGFSPLFSAEIAEPAKAVLKDRLFRRLGTVEAALDGQDYLLGGRFGVADAYLFAVLRWARFFAIDLQRWPAIAAFMARIGDRASVRAALDIETAAKAA